jgi:hypothetical protein
MPCILIKQVCYYEMEFPEFLSVFNDGLMAAYERLVNECELYDTKPPFPFKQFAKNVFKSINDNNTEICLPGHDSGTIQPENNDELREWLSDAFEMSAQMTVDVDTALAKATAAKALAEEDEANRKEIDETNGWEEVYNAGNQTIGNPLGGERRENPRLPGQEGIFYQTYGNGGFAGRRDGGYWAMRVSSGQHMPGVYEVAGEEFTLLEGVALEFRPEDSWRGVVAAVRIVPMKLSQEPHLAEGVKALEAEAMTNLLRLRADRRLRAAAAV